MRNIILVSLLVFLVIVGGGLSIAWFVQARTIKQSAEQAIAQLNKDATYLTYDSLETSGFPWYINLTMTNPRFAGRVDTLLEKIAPQQPAADAIAQSVIPRHQWNEDARFIGTVTFGTDALSSRYTLRFNGFWQNTSQIGDKTIELSSQSASEAMCVLEMDYSWRTLTRMWDMTILRDGARDFFNDLRSFDCGKDASVTIEKSSGDTLFSEGPQRFYVAQQKLEDKNRRSLRVYLKSSDVEITARGNEIFNTYLQALLPPSPDFQPIPLTSTGKQNIELDASYIGPKDPASATNQAMDVRVDKFYVDNAYINSTNTMAYMVIPGPDNHQLSLKLDSESLPKIGYDSYMENQVRQMVHGAYTNSDPRLAQAKENLAKYTEQQAFDIVRPAIPKFEPLGSWTTKIDAAYRGTPSYSTGAVVFNNVEIGVEPYGLALTGSLAKAEGKMPAPDMTLTCRNCPQLIDDLTAYLGRAHKALVAFNPEAAAPLGQSLAQAPGLKGFLAELAGNTTPDYVYKILGDGSPTATINGHGLAEIQAIHQKYLPSAQQ